MYGKFLKKGIGMVAFVTALKMAVFPLVVFGVYRYLYPTETSRSRCFLAGMPVAVTTFVIAEKFKLNTALVGNAIVFATLLAFVTGPLILTIFK